LLVFVFAALASAVQTLRVLTWPGYADADLAQAGERIAGL